VGAKAQFHQYRDASGRVHYVNDLASVPEKYRKQAKAVDLEKGSVTVAEGAEAVALGVAVEAPPSPLQQYAVKYWPLLALAVAVPVVFLVARRALGARVARVCLHASIVILGATVGISAYTHYINAAVGGNRPVIPGVAGSSTSGATPPAGVEITTPLDVAQRAREAATGADARHQKLEEDLDALAPCKDVMRNGKRIATPRGQKPAPCAQGLAR
jgi:hypothetical protein